MVSVTKSSETLWINEFSTENYYFILLKHWFFLTHAPFDVILTKPFLQKHPETQTWIQMLEDPSMTFWHVSGQADPHSEYSSFGPQFWEFTAKTV